jgi:hypothetical protein
MTPSSFAARRIGGLAIAIGGVTLIGIVSIILFFTFGGVFGPLNDLCNGVEAILTAVLAWRMYPWLRSHSQRLSLFTLVAAWAGAFIASIGSALVILGFTGWYLAALYTMVGYALVGLWLLSVNYAALQSFSWPRRLAQLGLATGVFMTVGFLAGPGIVGGVDAVDAAPWFVNVGQLGGLGWFLLYPIWCLWLGRLLLSQIVARPITTHS